MKKILLLLVATMCLTFSHVVYGQVIGDYGSNGAVALNSSTNWLVCVTNGTWAGATAAASAPTSATNVWILPGHTLTTATGAVNFCKDLNVVGGIITASGGNPRYITCAGVFNMTSGTVNLNSTSTNVYYLTGITDVNISGGTVDFSNTGGGACYIDFTGNLTVTGAPTFTVPAASTVERGFRFSGSGTTSTVSSTVALPTINVISSGTLTTASSFTMNRALWVTNASGTFNIASGHTITLAGTSGATNVTTSGGKISVDGTLINQSTTTMTLTGGSAITLNSGGTYVHQTSAGIATPITFFSIDNASTFIYRATAAVAPAATIAGRTFGNLTFDNTSGVWSTFGGISGATTCIVNGTLSIGGTNAGTVNTSTLAFTGTIDVNTDVSISSGSTFGLTTGNSPVTVAGNWTDLGTFTQGTGAVTFDGTSGNQTITKATGETFTKLTVNKSSGTLLLGGNATVTGTLAFTAGNLQLNTYDLTLTGASVLTPAAGKSVVTNNSGAAGKIKVTTTGTFTFPTGTSTKYAPVTITNTGGVSQTYSIGVVTPTTYAAPSIAADFDWYVGCSGTSASTLAFSWFTADAGATLAASPVLGHCFQNAVEFPLSSTATGSPNTTTVTGITSFAATKWNVATSTQPYFIPPTIAGFGNVVITQTGGPNSFTLQGNNMDGTAVTLSGLAGFSYSLDNITYTAIGGSLTFTPPAGALSQIIYIKFHPTVIQAYDGNVTISGGGALASVTLAITASGIASTNSTITATADLAAAGTYPYVSDIVYTTYTAASGLTTANTVGVMGLTLTDVGGATGDGLSTTLSGISFTVPANTGNAIRAAGLFNNSGQLVQELTTVSGTSIVFNSFTGPGTIVAANGASTTFQLRVTFKAAVVEHQMSFTVSAATASATGSNFNGGGGTGAVSATTTSATNRLKVVATQLVFTTQPPSSATVSTNLSATPVVTAQDANGSTDADYNFAGFTISNSGALGMTNATGTASNGVFTFNSNFQFTATGSVTISLVAGFTATSSTITIYPSPVIYNFGTGSGDANPTSGTPVANLSFSAVSQGNNNGTTTLLTNVSVSSGYSGVSGNYNGGAAANIGALNVTPVSATNASSAYFEFTITPAAGYSVILGGISFGSRSTATGPQAYTIRSNKDCFSGDIASGAIPNNSTWALYSPTITSVESFVGTPITFRIFGYGGTGSPAAGTANWRIDDLGITVLAKAVSLQSLSTTVSYLPDFAATNIGTGGPSQTFNLSGANLTGFTSNITVTAPTDFEVSNNNSTWGSSTTITYTSATLAATPVYVRLNPQSYGVKSGCVTFSGGGVGAAYLPRVWVTGSVNPGGVFYSKSTGNLNLTATWGTNTDGSGVAPADFTSNSQTFNIVNNATPTLGAAWTVAGTSSKVIVGNGAAAINFTVPSGFAFTTTSPVVVDVTNNGTLTLQNTSIPTYGTLSSGSTVDYAASAAQTVTTTTYSNLKLSGTNAKTFAGTTNITGVFTPTAGFSAAAGTIAFTGTGQTIPSFTFNNLTINGTGTAATTGVASGDITVNGALTVTTPLNVLSPNTLTLGTSATANTSGVLTVTGTLKNTSNGVDAPITSTTANLLFATASAAGTYEMAATARGQIPSATWVNGANLGTLKITGTTTGGGLSSQGYPGVFAPSASGFGHIIIDLPNYNPGTQVKPLRNFPNPLTIAGDLTLGNMNNKAAIQLLGGSTVTVNISGNLNVYGGSWQLNNGLGTINWTVGKDVIIDGTNVAYNGLGSFSEPKLYIASNVADITNLQINRHLTMTSGAVGFKANLLNTISSTNANIIFAGGVAQTATFDDPNTTDLINYEVKSTSSVSLNSDLTTSGQLKLTSGTFAINGNTLILDGTFIGSSANYLIGSATSNLTTDGTGTLGTLYFDQTTDGISNNIATFTLNRTATGIAMLGNKLVTGTALTLTNGKLYINDQALVINGTFTGSAVNSLRGSSSSSLTIGGTGSMPSAIYFDPTTVGTTNLLYSLTMNRTASGSATLGNNLVTGNNLTLANGQLYLNGTTLTLNGTFSGSAINNLVGSATSNLAVGGTGALGTLYFEQGTDGTTNNIATFTMNRTAFGTATLGNKMVSGTALTLTNGQFQINDQTLTLNGTFSGSTANNIVGSASSKLNIGGSGALGTLYFEQGTDGTTNNLLTFSIDRAGISSTIGNKTVVSNNLAITNGTLNIAANSHLDLNGASLTTPAPGGYLTANSTSDLTVRGLTGGTVTLPQNATLSIANITLGGNRVVAQNGTNNINLYGALTIASGTTWDNGGESQLVNTGGSVTITGKFITRALQGFTGALTSIPTIVPSLVAGSTIEFGRTTGDQYVSIRSDYKNLLFSGGGTKTHVTASPITPIAGTVSILDNTTLDVSNNTFGDAATNFTMTAGRFRTSGTGTRPVMGGTYNLTGGVVEFYNNSATAQTIRTQTYQNIEVTGSSVANSSGNITLNTNGSFIVKPTGVFRINDDAIVGPSTGEYVRVESGGIFKCGDVDGFSGGTGATATSVRADVDNIILDAGSTVEYSRGSETVPLVGGQVFSSRTDYKNVVINGGTPKTLSGPSTINESMTFTSGVVNTTSANLLTFENAATVLGSPGTSSYINGPAAKKMNAGTVTEFVLPLGKSTGSPIYNPAGIVPTTIGNATTFTGEYFVNPNQAQGIMGINVLGIPNLGYWDISNSVSAGNTARVKLYYTNPGNGNWIYYTGSPTSPYYTTASNPLFYCNVAVVRRDASTVTWSFTSSFGNFNSTDPESRSYANNGFIYSHDPTLPFTRFSLGYSINSILPINLVNFAGKLQGADGRLDWTVADSKDLSGFELQYSRDGRQFNRLADIAGNAGTGYSYLHNQLPGGANFYRLLVKEKSGRTFYSNVVLLSVGKLRTQIIGLKENPVHSNLSVLIVSAGNQTVSAQLSDALGRNITRSQSQLQAGQNQWTINTQALAKGMYFVQLLTEDGERSTIRFIKD